MLEEMGLSTSRGIASLLAVTTRKSQLWWTTFRFLPLSCTSYVDTSSATQHTTTYLNLLHRSFTFFFLWNASSFIRWHHQAWVEPCWLFCHSTIYTDLPHCLTAAVPQHKLSWSAFSPTWHKWGLSMSAHGHSLLGSNQREAQMPPKHQIVWWIYGNHRLHVYYTLGAIVGDVVPTVTSYLSPASQSSWIGSDGTSPPTHYTVHGKQWFDTSECQIQPTALLPVQRLNSHHSHSRVWLVHKITHTVSSLPSLLSCSLSPLPMHTM